MNMSELTHINVSGDAYMVDISGKVEIVREARAEAFVEMAADTLAMIISGSHHKGDVFAAARIAGIQAAKKNLGSDSAVPSTVADQGRSES